MDNAIKLKTADIRKLVKIKLLDAIIAATALINDLTLLTSNTRDFKHINAMSLLNPYDF